MKTSSRRAGSEPARIATTPAQEPPADTGPLRTMSRRASPTVVPHRSEVLVTGELTAPVEPRRRTDGREVLAFRVAVRSSGNGEGGDPAPPGSREPGGAGRRDVLDCVVSATAVRRRLETYRAGDVVELSGPLRHRFWNSAGRIHSRYEIEVVTLRRLTRAARVPDP